MSLIEILVTITIISILCAAAFYTYQDYKIKSMYNSTFNTIEQNKMAVSNFYAKNKRCPINNPNNFIDQALPPGNAIGSRIVSGDNCIINLLDNDGSGNIISIEARIRDLTGDLQFFCTLGTSAPSVEDQEKFLTPWNCRDSTRIPTTGFSTPT
jgi:type II secretory pathway pseudopilin PulG